MKRSEEIKILSKMLYKTIWQYLFPIKCKHCATTIAATALTYTFKNEHGHEILLSSTEFDICRECLADNILETFEENEDSIPLNECQSCGERRLCDTTLLSQGAKFVYGMRWWNGWKVCELCLHETAILGKESTGIFLWVNNFRCAVNNRGAAVGVPIPVLFRELFIRIKNLF